MSVDDPNNGAAVPVLQDEPWLKKKAWADGQIRSAGTIGGLLFFTTLWCLISFPVGWLVLRGTDLRTADWGHRLAMIFPAIGVVLLVCTLVAFLRWRKYGRSVFEMASMPGVIGGQVAGVIRTAVKIEPEDAYRIRLGCINVTTRSSGSKKNISRSLIWQDEMVVTQDLMAAGGEQSAIPVLFQIPYDCRPCDDSDRSSIVEWNLEVGAKTRGLDYVARFDVPVFKTAESDPNFKIDRELLAQYSAPEDPQRDVREAGLVREPAPDGEGWRWTFPMARHPGTALVFLVVGLVFAGGPAVWMYLDFGMAALIFGGIGILFGLLMFYAAIDVMFYRSTVDASRRGLTVCGGLFGRGASRHIAAADVTRIDTVSNMKTDSLMYYDLVIDCRDGSKVTAGKRVPGQRLANSVIRQIEQAMGRERLEALGLSF